MFSNWSRLDYLLLLVGIVHVCFVFIGFGNSITDIHGFRQTQTAISAYYFVKDGFQILYDTPVLGFPWKIPFEFPFYQGVVALLVKVFNLPLEISGRIVSLLFFYGVFPFIYLLRIYIVGLPWKWVFIFLLANPIYIFWSRTFLIESTALFFAIGFIYFSLRTLESPIVWYVVLGLLLFSILGILIKVTTFFVGLVAVSTICLYKFQLKSWKNLIWNKLLWVFIVSISFLIQFVWLKQTDALKAQNIIGTHLTSANLSKWNFGSWEQRGSWGQWQGLNIFSCDTLVISVVLGLLLLSFRKFTVRQPYFLIFLFVGLIGPLVFFNLYYVHNYYHYANTIYLIIAIAFGLKAFKNQIVKAGMLAVILSLWYFDYFKYYYDPQVINDLKFETIGKQVAESTKANDVILVLGSDWGSEIPYYSERKAICVPEWSIQEFKKNPKAFIEDLHTPNIKHIVLVNNYSSKIPDSFILKTTKYLGLNRQLYFSKTGVRLLTK